MREQAEPHHTVAQGANKYMLLTHGLLQVFPFCEQLVKIYHLVWMVLYPAVNL